MAVQWIKIRTDIFDDEKIKLIDAMPDRDAIFVIWIKLLTLAGRCNHSGSLILSESIPYTDDMLAAIFARPISVVRLGLSIFERFGMVEIGDKIKICNWEKHQNEAGLEIIRNHDAERKRIYRRKQSELEDMSRTSPGQVPESPALEEEEEIDKDFKKEKEEPVFSREYNPSNLSTRIQSMIDEWNSSGAKPPYRKTVLNIPPDKMRDIAATFTSYGDDEIKEAIRNYLGVIASSDHEAFPTYGTFIGFMGSGVEQYCDDADPYARCKTGTKKADDAWRAKANAILDAEDQDGQA